MSLICSLFGHKYKEKLVDFIRLVREKGLEFYPSICSDVVEEMKRNEEDPVKEHVCKRCGHKISYVGKFLNKYRGS